MGPLPELEAIDLNRHLAGIVDVQKRIRLLVRLKLGRIAPARRRGPHSAGGHQPDGKAGCAGQLDEPAAAHGSRGAGLRNDSRCGSSKGLMRKPDTVMHGVGTDHDVPPFRPGGPRPP